MVRVIGLFGVVLGMVAGVLMYARRDEPEQWIAFISNRDGNAEIYRMRPDGSDVQQLTHTEDLIRHCWVQWADNGASLIFGRDFYGGLCDYYNSPPKNFKLHLETGIVTEIVSGMILSVSSDGEWLSGIDWLQPLRPSVFLVPIDGNESDKQYLIEGADPIFSPDGRKLAMTGIDSQIYIYDRDRAESKKLEIPDLDGCYLSFAWDASSEWILFNDPEMPCNGMARLKKINIENGNIEIIDNILRLFVNQHSSNLSSSPDGQWYSYAYRKLIVIESQTGAYREVAELSLNLVSSQQFDWSPDSNWLVFNAKDENDNIKIFRVHPDGTGLEQLTFGEGDDLQATWSPEILITGD